MSADSVLGQYPPVVQFTMCSRVGEFSVKLDEKITKIASALTGTDDPRTRHVRLLLIE